MKIMLAGVAALALAASGAAAQPGGGNGGGHAAHAPRGGDESRGNGNGGGPGAGNGNGNANRGPEQRSNPGGGNGNGNGRPDVHAAVERQGERGNGNNRVERAVVNRNDVRGAIDAGRNTVARARINNDERRGEWRGAPSRYVFDGKSNDRDLVRYVGLVDGCPPGLAAKNNGCQPPGQARKNRYFVRDGYDLNWWGLPRYDDRVYRYDSGYLLRLNPDGGIGGYIPLLGGALAIGNVWPQTYGYDALSPYYTSYYGLGPSGSYRFADNVVYRVDPQTSAINAVAALLTGDDFVVGQAMPSGYDVYNVPYGYRDRYVDGLDAYYRYSDGYIYQVDPETQLIAAAIEMLVS